MQKFVGEGGIDQFPDPEEPVVFMDSEGREVPNPEPIVIYLPSGPVSDYDRVREMIKRELSIEAARDGMETEEEANDFDVEGDMFPVSAHEYTEATEAADREAFELEAERQRRDRKKKKPSSGKPDEGAGSEGGTPSPDQGEEP